MHLLSHNVVIYLFVLISRMQNLNNWAGTILKIKYNSKDK